MDVGGFMGLGVVYKDAGAHSPTVRIPSNLMEAFCAANWPHFGGYQKSCMTPSI